MDAGGAEDEALGTGAALTAAAGGKTFDTAGDGAVITGVAADVAGAGTEATVTIFGLSQLPVTR